MAFSNEIVGGRGIPEGSDGGGDINYEHGCYMIAQNNLPHRDHPGPVAQIPQRLLH